MYDRVEFRYNRQGEPTEKKDQNGTVRQFDYDALGRLVADKVTTVGSGVDAVVRRIARAYEVRGMLEKLTSYDAASGGNALNEVLFDYDSAGLLSKEYQEHAGTKDAETLYVQYNYDQSASGGIFTKGLRPASLRYPNARLVHTTYGTTGSAADALSRIAAINADNSGSPGDALPEYQYLGLGTIVTEDYPEPDVKLDYVGDGSYSGFDRFGRVVDHKWYDYGANAVRDQYTYGYDRASNRLYRENTTASGKDEFYGYDEINRLVAFDRGDLNAQKTAISGTPVREEDWTLDPLGNWPGYVQKTSGTTELDQDRTHNKVNEITAITATTGTDWADPVHDRAGNMTTVPKPSSLADTLTCTYDAWNRLVEVQDGETTIGRYEYDGLNRRIKKHLDSQAPSDPNGIDKYVHYFYNDDWQILETRETTTESAEPEDLQPKHQYLWSLRYIDAPILRDENTDQDNLCDDQRLYYLGDANFNVTTLLDTSGDAIERYLYAPYGTVTIYDPTWANTRSTSTCSNTTLYTGRELDSESSLYHYRNRYYNPSLGTFISRDPISYVSGLNLLAYVRHRPQCATDPFGLEIIEMPMLDPLCPKDDPAVKEWGQPGVLLRAVVDNAECTIEYAGAQQIGITEWTFSGGLKIKDIGVGYTMTIQFGFLAIADAVETDICEDEDYKCCFTKEGNTKQMDPARKVLRVKVFRDHNVTVSTTLGGTKSFKAKVTDELGMRVFTTSCSCKCVNPGPGWEFSGIQQEVIPLPSP